MRPADLPPRRASRANNFDVLRLCAAAAVLISHSYALSGVPEPHVGNLSLGTAAVVVFFSISGYLIAQSWRFDPRPIAFTLKRGLRILPALFVVACLTALVLGPIVTRLDPTDYFGQVGPWEYIVRNTAILSPDYDLPGVFALNAYPNAVNGSLWTLPWEIAAYCLIGLLGVLGAMHRPKLAIPLLLAAFICTAGLGTYGVIIRAFCAGSILFLLGRRVRLTWTAVPVLVAVWALAYQIGRADLWIAPVIVAYLSLLFAYQTPPSLRRITARGDFSYGLYLYAFPVQQVIAQLIAPTAVLMMAVALPVTYVLAAASWVFVEQPALGLKRLSTFARPAVKLPDEPAARVAVAEAA